MLRVFDIGAIWRRFALSVRWDALIASMLIACLAVASADPAAARRRNRSHHDSHRTEKKQKRSGPLFAIVSIGDQHVSFYGVEGLVARAPVSTGQRGHRTPTGVFSILQKKRVHYSNIYHGASMPYMQRITWTGVAMHAGVLPGYPASHGCIRMPHSFARRIFRLTKIGQRVLVVPRDIAPAGITHGNLPVPTMHPARDEPDPAIKAEASGEETRVVVAEAEVEAVRDAEAGPAQPAIVKAEAPSAKLLNPMEYARALWKEADAQGGDAVEAVKETSAALSAAKKEERTAAGALRLAEKAVENKERELAGIDRRIARFLADEETAKRVMAGKGVAEGKIAEAEKALAAAHEARELKDKELEAAREAKDLRERDLKAAREAEALKAKELKAAREAKAQQDKELEAAREAADKARSESRAAKAEDETAQAGKKEDQAEAADKPAEEENEEARAAVEAVKAREQEARSADETVKAREEDAEAAARAVKAGEESARAAARAVDAREDEVRAAAKAVRAAEAALKTAKHRAKVAARRAARAEEDKADTERARARKEEAKAALEVEIAEARKVVEEARQVKDAADRQVEAADKAARDAETVAETLFARIREAKRRLKPVSVFISRKTGRLYVRQAFKPVFDVPVSIKDPERPIGTHVYVALDSAPDGRTLKWSAVSVPDAERKKKRRRRKRHRRSADDSVPETTASIELPPETAAGALDRVEIPEDAAKRISELAWVGASVIISDRRMSGETNDSTDFIIKTRGR